MNYPQSPWHWQTVMGLLSVTRITAGLRVFYRQFKSEINSEQSRRLMLCLVSPMLTIKHTFFVQQVRTKRTTTETDRKLVKWDDSGLIITPRKKIFLIIETLFKAAVEQNWVELLETLEKFQLFLNSSIVGPAVAQEVTLPAAVCMFLWLRYWSLRQEVQRRARMSKWGVRYKQLWLQG